MGWAFFYGILVWMVRIKHLFIRHRPSQSLTGEYCEQTINNPPILGETYQERYGKMFWHAFAEDQHLPFTCEEVDHMIQRIAPEYLTFEFITGDSSQHKEYLQMQKKALFKIRT